MNLEPTVFIDLSDVGYQSARRHKRLFSDPLAPDNVKIKDEVTEGGESNPVSLQPVEFIDIGSGRIKLEGFEAIPIESVNSRIIEDPLAVDGVQIKDEDLTSDCLFLTKNNPTSTSTSVQNDDYDTFLSAVTKLKRITLRQPLQSNEPNSTTPNDGGKTTDESNTVGKSPNLPTAAVLSPDLPTPNGVTGDLPDQSSSSDLSGCTQSEISSPSDRASNDDTFESNNPNNSSSTNLKRPRDPSTKRDKQCKLSLESRINYDKVTGSSRRSRNSLLTALDGNIEPESFKEIIEKLLVPNESSCTDVPLKNTRNKIDKTHPNFKIKSKQNSVSSKKSKVKAVITKINNKASKTDNTVTISTNFIDKSFKVGNNVDLNKLPIKNCSVVLEELDISKMNLPNNDNIVDKGETKIVKNKGLLNSESKLLSLQLFKEISRIEGSINATGLTTDQSLKTNVNIVAESSLSNLKWKDCRVTMTNILATSKEELNKPTLSKKKVKSKILSSSNKRKALEDRRSTLPSVNFKHRKKSVEKNTSNEKSRVKNKSVNYNENYSDDDFENLINELNTISEKGAMKKASRSDDVSLKSGDEVRRGKVKRKDFKVKKKTVKKNKGKAKKNTMPNGDDGYELDLAYLNEESGDDIETDVHIKKDPDWIEYDNGDSLDNGDCSDDEFEGEIVDLEMRPVVTVELGKVKNYGKHPVLKNEESLERIKNEFVRRQSSCGNFDPDGFQKVLEDLLTESGMAGNNTGECTELSYCQFCDFNTSSELQLMKHLRMHFSNISKYSCLYCHYGSTSKYHTNRHMHMVHGADLTYVCKICSFTTNSKDQLIEHKMQLHNEPNPYRCDKCDFRTRDKTRLKSHIERKHTENPNLPYKCRFCEYRTDKPARLKRHLTVHTKSNYTCRICGYTSKRDINWKTNTMNLGRDNMIKHMNQMHDGEKMFKCDLCNYSSNFNYLLTHHVKYTHNKMHKYFCDLCPFKGAHKRAVTYHIELVHRKVKKFECEICGKKFGRKREMEDHTFYVHKKATLVYKCESCNFESYRKQELDIHKKVKHMTAPDLFKCHYCTFSAPLKRRVLLHINRRHDLKRPYFCIYCKFKSADEDGVKNHMIIHEKNRPHKCNLCQFRANKKSHLVQHFNSKHRTTKDFVCFYCDWCTTRKEHLIRHILAKHDFESDLLVKSTNSYLPNTKKSSAIRNFNYSDVKPSTSKSSTNDFIPEEINDIIGVNQSDDKLDFTHYYKSLHKNGKTDCNLQKKCLKSAMVSCESINSATDDQEIVAETSDQHLPEICSVTDENERGSAESSFDQLIVERGCEEGNAVNDHRLTKTSNCSERNEPELISRDSNLNSSDTSQNLQEVNSEVNSSFENIEHCPVEENYNLMKTPVKSNPTNKSSQDATISITDDGKDSSKSQNNPDSISPNSIRRIIGIPPSNEYCKNDETISSSVKNNGDSLAIGDAPTNKKIPEDRNNTMINIGDSTYAVL